MNKTLVFFGWTFLLAIEILRIYLIMPFPGSQQTDTIGLAYFLSEHMVLLRILGWLIVLFPTISYFSMGRKGQRIFLLTVLAGYLGIFYFFNFRFEADKMFYQPRNKYFETSGGNKVDTNQLVIAALIHGEAKAYPIEIIGYHHQVQDTIGNVPVMITYCTVCRTGRIYSPDVHGKFQHFRLVGMDHFNAIFEDQYSKSWWRQATGMAVAGPLKGTHLTLIPSQQMRLAAWLRAYPKTLILQPDSSFQKQYAELAGFDRGTIKSKLEKRDSFSWKKNSWVVGILIGRNSKVYDWNELCKKRVINDRVGDLPITIFLERDTASFHAWEGQVDGKTLRFTYDSLSNVLVDTGTGSRWTSSGYCISGPFKGSSLNPITAFQEFWHSWKTFHPKTSVYP
ncbi:MAG: DUF3179 domain-containing (seleno)protein [Chitinophagaceae bacterium]